MRQIIKRILSCAVLVCLIGISLSYLTGLMERKESRFKYEAFFSQKEDFDVLFMGSSHVVNAVFPMELWNDYGIVSYNMGGHANQLATTYWVMENALDHTTPKLMVIDGMHLNFNIKTGYDFSNIHISFDAFPFSATKMAAIRDLLDDEEMDKKIEEGETVGTELRTELGILWDYSVYHSRWSELRGDDFSSDTSKEKGAESRIAVGKPREIVEIPSDSVLEEETLGIQYMRKMIEECQERGIAVLLVYLPFPPQEQDFKNANRMYQIAEEYGINYINFLDMDIVDYSTDCYDEGSHLNPSGARKVTDYLGRYIMDNYEIPDQRTNEAYDGWYDAYEEYKEFKTSNIREEQELDNYLMLLADKDYDVMIEIFNPVIWKNEYYCNLFKNLGVDSTRITEKTDLLAVGQGGRTVNYFENFHEYGNWEDLYIESTDFAAETPENADIHLIVMDSGTGQSVDNVYFSFQTKEDIPDGTITAIGAER